MNALYEWFWKNDEISPLDEYVHTDDGYFEWENKGEVFWGPEDLTPGLNITNYRVFYLNVTSQKWLEPTIVSRSIWFHETYVIVPKIFSPELIGKSIVYIDGGNNSDDPNKTPPSSPWYETELMMKLVSDLGVACMVVRQIPNEKLRFYDDHYSQYRVICENFTKML